MKRTHTAQDLNRIEQTVLLQAIHDKLQGRDLIAKDHQTLRKLYYTGLWATKVTFDIGPNELPHALAMTNEWDYSEYPLIKRRGVIINRPSTFPQSLFIEGVQTT